MWIRRGNNGKRACGLKITSITINSQTTHRNSYFIILTNCSFEQRVGLVNALSSQDVLKSLGRWLLWLQFQDKHLY